MEMEPNQDDPNPSPTKLEPSLRRPLPVGGGDRLKRDEWSEGAVSSLLEAYESKWILRNRAKLKGQDWEDVAKHVSSRSNNTKSLKTQTQCKNKIESMKKRYRSESANTADASSWPLFSRLDSLLRGTGGSSGLPPGPPLPQSSPRKAIEVANNPGLVLESSPVAQQVPASSPGQPAQHSPAVEIAQNSQESSGMEPLAKEDDAVATKVSDHVSDKNHSDDHIETDSSTPALCSNDKDIPKSKAMKMMKKKKRTREECNNSWEDISESIRWLADAVVRSEQARMDTMRELERMRVEAEAKRCEMDLKRTEIMANTQLEIAKIFAAVTAGKNVDSSLRIGRS